MARILVVEDDPIQLEMRKQILENAGHEVFAAQNVSRAIELWSGCDLVLMDLRIPKLQDGIRLIRAIARATPIIVLSGGEVDPALPVDEILTKPYPSKRLIETIDKWTSASK